VCRRVETTPAGELTVHNVVEVLAVDQVPGDVGPLVFLALVRDVPAGPGEGAFRIRPPAGTNEPGGRMPLKLDVPAAYGGRQVAVHVRLPSLPVTRGGWYEVAFEWGGRVLATNRFAVGVRTARQGAPGG
jgi:hypothetical protein